MREILRDAVNILLTVLLVAALSSLVHKHIAEIKAQNTLILNDISKLKSCCFKRLDNVEVER